MGYFIGPITNHIVAVRFSEVPLLLRADLAKDVVLEAIGNGYKSHTRGNPVLGARALALQIERPRSFVPYSNMRSKFSDHLQVERAAIEVIRKSVTEEMSSFSYADIPGANCRNLEQLDVLLTAFLSESKLAVEFGYEHPTWLRIAASPSLASRWFSVNPKPGATQALIHLNEIRSLEISPKQLQFGLTSGKHVALTRQRTYP